jgi:hypothetical protein
MRLAHFCMGSFKDKNCVKLALLCNDFPKFRVLDYFTLFQVIKLVISLFFENLSILNNEYAVIFKCNRVIGNVKDYKFAKFQLLAIQSRKNEHWKFQKTSQLKFIYDSYQRWTRGQKNSCILAVFIKIVVFKFLWSGFSTISAKICTKTDSGRIIKI